MFRLLLQLLLLRLFHVIQLENVAPKEAGLPVIQMPRFLALLPVVVAELAFIMVEELPAAQMETANILAAVSLAYKAEEELHAVAMEIANTFVLE